MFDIGFWELLVIGVVLLLVMGPERLPEVARHAAFLVRKARQGMYRLRSEMQSEMDGTPFADLENAKREISDFKNDIQQFGRDLADSAEDKITPSSVADKTTLSEGSANKTLRNNKTQVGSKAGNADVDKTQADDTNASLNDH